MFTAAVLVAAPGALAGELKVEKGEVMHGKDKWTTEEIRKLTKNSTLHQTTADKAKKQDIKIWTHKAKTLGMEPALVKVNGDAKTATYTEKKKKVVKVTAAKMELTTKGKDGKDVVYTVEQTDAESNKWGDVKDSASEKAEAALFEGADFAALFTAGKDSKHKFGKGDEEAEYNLKITAAVTEEIQAASMKITFSEPLITLELAKEGEGEEEQWKGTSGKVAFAFKVSDKPTPGSIEVTKDGKAVKMVLTADPVIDGEKCTMTLQDATVANTTATFTLKDGKWVDSADAKDQKKVVVSEDEPLVWTSENEDFKSDADMLALIKDTAATHTWTFEAAKKSGYMMWIIIGCSVLLIAVICFFVFGGKKNTDSDDESDLDTSDDEEEDAAATETKEEEA